MLMGVRGSWKTRPAAVIVTTSLKIPQILRVTTEVRWRRANSEAVIKKAKVPGKIKMRIPMKSPLASTRDFRPAPRGTKPSTGMAMMARLTNMTGARKKMLLKGLLVAGLRRSSIWVRAQRKPEKKAAAMTRAKPITSKATSPATIIMTPTVMVAIMRMSLTDGDSRRNRKAKQSTKASEEDLHIAAKPQISKLLPQRDEEGVPTVKGKSNELQAHIS